jgi:hypothetical protein
MSLFQKEVNKLFNLSVLITSTVEGNLFGSLNAKSIKTAELS